MLQGALCHISQVLEIDSLVCPSKWQLLCDPEVQDGDQDGFTSSLPLSLLWGVPEHTNSLYARNCRSIAIRHSCESAHMEITSHSLKTSTGTNVLLLCQLQSHIGLLCWFITSLVMVHKSCLLSSTTFFIYQTLDKNHRYRLKGITLSTGYIS